MSSASSSSGPTPELCFSESYEEARNKFRAAAKDVAELHELLVFEDALGKYIMDIAVVQGSGRGLIAISSGTHGVEGYAGSAIQVRLLNLLKLKRVASTVLIVHAVNPFGMAHFRRWNENNVDLNRNALEPHHFKQLTEGDTLNSTYMCFDTLFNPKEVPGWFYTNFGIWFDMIWAIFRHGLRALKTALLGATYSQSKGIFFGGQELQASNRLLRSFVEKHFSHIPAGEVIWNDVHTGLGPCGVDVLLCGSEDLEQLQKVFPKVDGECDGCQGSSGKSAADDIVKARCKGGIQVQANGPVNQSAGYEFTAGFLGSSEWVAKFFKPNSGRPLVFTQEFGTVSNLKVARALVLENIGYHYDRDRHEYWRSFTRDAFYVRSLDWKIRILKRGEDTFHKLVAKLEGSF